MLTIYLIRHAQSQANLDKTSIGGRNNEVELSQEGHRQAGLLAQRLSQINFDVLYVSSARRTQQTASYLQAKEHILSDALVERDMGDWTGNPISEIFTQDTIDKLKGKEASFRPPNGESFKDVAQRYMDFIEQEILAQKDADQTIGIVSHGNAIKSVLYEVLGIKQELIWRIHIHNTSITQLIYDQHGWRLERINDAAHLEMLPDSDSEESSTHNQPNS